MCFDLTANQTATGQWIQQLINTNNLHEFYTSSQWLRLRAEVLQEYKYECQHCKARGFYTKADTVHHDRYVKKYPWLALSKVWIDSQGNERKQLIPLCHNCHELAHHHRQKKKEKPLTPERW